MPTTSSSCLPRGRELRVHGVAQLPAVGRPRRTWTPRRCPRRGRRANPARARAASGHRRWPGRSPSSWRPGRRTAPAPAVRPRPSRRPRRPPPRRPRSGCSPGPWALAPVTKRSAPVLSPMTSPNDAFSEDAKTLMLTTRVSPIISAAAVEAVRRGLRIAFCFASSPGSPRSCIGAAISAASGRTTSGQRHDDPDERGDQAEAEELHAGVAVQAGQQAGGTEAEQGERRRRRAASRASRRRRWTHAVPRPGSTLVARRAGTMAATTVTSVPTSIETMTVRGSICSEVVGRLKPDRAHQRSASPCRRRSRARLRRPRPRRRSGRPRAAGCA